MERFRVEAETARAKREVVGVLFVSRTAKGWAVTRDASTSALARCDELEEAMTEARRHLKPGEVIRVKS